MKHLPQKPWLEAKDICFNSHGQQILDRLSLAFRAGELTLLVGRNGCGKTTLLKILAGLLRPDDGSFLYGGTEATWPQRYKLLQTEVCYLHQNPYLFDTSVFQNIAYGLKCRKLAGRELEQRVHRALAIVSAPVGQSAVTASAKNAPNAAPTTRFGVKMPPRPPEPTVATVATTLSRNSDSSACVAISGFEAMRVMTSKPLPQAAGCWPAIEVISLPSRLFAAFGYTFG